MPHASRSRQAKRDLAGIVRHIADDNPSAATRWLDGIESLFRLMSTQPEIGQQLVTRRGEIIRRFGFGNYVIYYQPRKYDVFILRVFHGAQDHERRI